MKYSYRSAVLIISGFLTLIMTPIFPIAGGGESLILTISVPFFIVIGIVLAWLYRMISKRVNDVEINSIVFSLLLFFLIAFTVLVYPFETTNFYEI